MATLALTAVGTLIGGPIGGALGALAGRSIDSALIGTPTREGPRLAELSVTTSSYGSAIPKILGKMRVPGSIIWAADLRETRNEDGGSKGQPSTTSFSYSASFAVALSSGAIADVRRIWADGNLLRGSAGDLKTGGSLRVYRGGKDQSVDPLISSDLGAACTAFRGLAYIVFEDLQLEDFGNRIPTLSFEVIASTGAMALKDLLDEVDAVAEDRMDGVAGYSVEHSIASACAALGRLIPLQCDSTGQGLKLALARKTEPVLLANPSTAIGGDSFGAMTGKNDRRVPPPANIPEAIRYYDPARDYQPGQQRAAGSVSAGQPEVIELPAAMEADAARRLIGSSAHRSRAKRRGRSWRSASFDPALRPGTTVALQDDDGLWQIETWEWGSEGIELQLSQFPASETDTIEADSGGALLSRDALIPETDIWAFELPAPHDLYGASGSVAIALSAANSAWRGAALYALEEGGDLAPIASSGSGRARLGSVEGVLGPGPMHVVDRQNALMIQLIDPDMDLLSVSLERMAYGGNRALVGNEIVQFSCATPLGEGRFELSGLLRGRGGTEHEIDRHEAGERFVMLDGALHLISPEIEGAGQGFAAIGYADPAPAVSSVSNAGLAYRPPCPVHVRYRYSGADDQHIWCWTRRSRGSWLWSGEVEPPLNEQREAYEVALCEQDITVARWETDTQSIALEASTLADLIAEYPAASLSVRQIGDRAYSLPALLPSP